MSGGEIRLDHNGKHYSILFPAGNITGKGILAQECCVDEEGVWWYSVIKNKKFSSMEEAVKAIKKGKV